MKKIRCRSCERMLVEITLSIEGSSRVMRSCSFCDRREWEDDSGVTDLDEVLVELNEAVGRRR